MDENPLSLCLHLLPLCLHLYSLSVCISALSSLCLHLCSPLRPLSIARGRPVSIQSDCFSAPFNARTVSLIALIHANTLLFPQNLAKVQVRPLALLRSLSSLSSALSPRPSSCLFQRERSTQLAPRSSLNHSLALRFYIYLCISLLVSKCTQI